MTKTSYGCDALDASRVFGSSTPEDRLRSIMARRDAAIEQHKRVMYMLDQEMIGELSQLRGALAQAIEELRVATIHTEVQQAAIDQLTEQK